MDEATRESSEAVDGTGAEGPRSPEEIEREIEATRAQLGETVEELARKADVKAQAKERVASIKETAQHRTDELAAKVRESSPDGAREGAEQIKAEARRNPLPFAVGAALVAGFILGRISAG